MFDLNSWMTNLIIISHQCTNLFIVRMTDRSNSFKGAGCRCVAMISGFPDLIQASAFNVCSLSLELLVMAFGTGWAFRMSSEQNNILFSF